MANTANYAWVKPITGASENTWGTTLNTALDDIDTDLKATDDAVAATVIVANAALPKAGGTTTGLIRHHSGTIGFVNLGTTSGTVTLDLADGNWFRVKPNGATTFAFSNVPSTASFASAVIVQVAESSVLPTWPASVKWPLGVSPSTYSTLGVDTFALFTIDAGVTWLASKIQDDVR